MTTTSEPLVRCDVADGVATITLNRPDKLNALSPALFVELRDHIDAIGKQTETVGCVVLTGAGRSFCAGNDLAAIAAREQAPSPHFQAETIDAIEALPQPVIGRVKGHCFTGGLELALGCDVIVAGESAQFGDTHGRWGLAPVWGMSVRLPERVGRSRAKDMMFTGRRVSGEEALRIGLADRCVPDDELDAAVAEITSAIVANSWGTSRIDKQLLAASARMLRDDALAHERTAPYGFPEDMAERMAGSTKPKA
ncbi:MAG TPA: enoyl-CoA hydratase/isomerase family protein [Acidimicrobiales bacterium]|nr:enoyl-CoA hydratase/isomerase family protein [Acidimicrobiales bacterium]